MASIVAQVQALLQLEYEQNPEEGAAGPWILTCENLEGPALFGASRACRVERESEPGFEVEPIGALLLVLDDQGTVSWIKGSSIPDNHEDLRAYLDNTVGQSCKRMASNPNPPFGAGTADPEVTYFWAVASWFNRGHSKGKDPDGNGRPCENAFDADVIERVYSGGQMSR